MTPNIEEIRLIRKKLGITQAELAKKASVSQSLIAKIESEKIDPAYSSVIKIFSTLDSITKKHSLVAKDVMQKKIITADEDDTIKETIKKMKKYQISQIPVTFQEKTVGVVSESSILDAFLEKKESMKVGDIMDQVPPTITKDTDIEVVSNLLKFFQIVLVADKGRPVGIITKADLLENLYS